MILKKWLRFLRLGWASLALCLALSLVFGLQPPSGVAGQGALSLILDQIDAQAYPQVSLRASVFDERGFVLPGLAGVNFSVVEAGGAPRPVTLEPVYERPLNVLVTLDTGVTMTYGPKPAPLDSLSAGLKEFLTALPTQDYVALQTFNETISAVQPLGIDRAVALAALDALSPRTGSALNAALSAAAGTLSLEPGARPVLILITDGRDAGAGKITLAQAVETLRTTQAVVYPVVWGTAKLPEIKQLADHSHGLYQSFDENYPTAGQLQTALGNIQTHLDQQRLQYALSYTSGLACDGGTYEISLQLEHLNRQAQAGGQISVPECAIEISLPDLTSGQEVGGITLIAPRFNRPEVIDSLELLIDDAPLTKVASAPFEYRWDSSSLPSGEHTLSLVARDRDGNSNRLDLQLVVRPPVMVALLAPADGAALDRKTTLQADISALAKIARVEFLVDGKPVGALTEPPFELEWDPQIAGEGGHELKAVAEDVNGFTGEARARFSVGPPGGGGKGFGLAIAAVIAAAALAVGTPLALRSRRARKSGGAAPNGLAAGLAGLNEVAGLNPGQFWPLSGDGEIRLGRKRDENDIQLDGAEASRRHAVIRWDGDAYIVISQKADNPVLVNGEPVLEQALYPGDRLTMGASEFVFNLE